MAATAKVYESIVAQIDGDTVEVGSLVSPVGEFSFSGSYRVHSEFTCAAGGGELTVWVRGNTTDFDAWYIRPITGGSGVVYVAYQWKDTDSAGDPQGDPFWFHLELPCGAGGMVLWTDSIRVPEGMPGSLSTFYGDTGSDRPSLWDATLNEGLITKIMIRNPGTTAIVVERLILD